MLDVDGNGTPDALTDGILILRYLFDPNGAWNYSDALGSGATRTTRTQIKAFLDQYNPSLGLMAGLAAAAPAGEPDAPMVSTLMTSGDILPATQTVAEPPPSTGMGGTIAVDSLIAGTAPAVRAGGNTLRGDSGGGRLFNHATILYTEPTSGIDARTVRFEHRELSVIVRSMLADRLLDVCRVQRNSVGVLFYDGKYVDTLASGLYAFWKGTAEAKLVEIDLRETMLDIGGQEIMTADKVTLRLNAVATYRVFDARQAVTAVDDVRQALYREAQLALRAVVGARELDTFLTAKDGVAKELEDTLRQRANTLGVEIIAVGIRDVILPGEMKDLMNKVTEAKKAAEANLIARREETAAMRSQANTARLLDDNPTLMRLRELEVLERVAASGKLNVVLGEKGLAERVVNLL